MLDANDRERVVKSVQTADLLVQDLRDLVKSENPLLADLALDLLKPIVEVEQRLKRIESVTCDHGKSV